MVGRRNTFTEQIVKVCYSVVPVVFIIMFLVLYPDSYFGHCTNLDQLINSGLLVI